MTQSFPCTPTTVDPRRTASMEYSTCNKCPSGLNTVMARSYDIIVYTILSIVRRYPILRRNLSYRLLIIQFVALQHYFNKILFLITSIAFIYLRIAIKQVVEGVSLNMDGAYPRLASFSS